MDKSSHIQTHKQSEIPSRKRRQRPKKLDQKGKEEFLRVLGNNWECACVGAWKQCSAGISAGTAGAVVVSVNRIPSSSSPLPLATTLLTSHHSRWYAYLKIKKEDSTSVEASLLSTWQHTWTDKQKECLLGKLLLTLDSWFDFSKLTQAFYFSATLWDTPLF